MQSVALEKLSSSFDFDVIPVCVYTDADSILWRQSEESQRSSKKQTGTGMFVLSWLILYLSACTFPDCFLYVSARLSYVRGRFCTFLPKFCTFLHRSSAEVLQVDVRWTLSQQQIYQEAGPQTGGRTPERHDVYLVHTQGQRRGR